ncbi:MAG: hypothetical protein ACP6IP_09080 [Candidatus Njordarchaeia archaeon]
MGEVIYFVPHTHWDREWYLTFGEYRQYLVRTLDRLIKALEGGELDYFLFDGQTSVILDYLKLMPEMEKKICDLVREGNLGIGPWYTQPDEFSVSGESLVRNLLYGLRICGKFGGCLRIGYLPDIFGHTPQLPQILNGFGIDTFLFSRGYDGSLGCDFVWEAPDGSRVYARYLQDGYCNAMLLGVTDRENVFTATVGPYDRFFPHFSTYEFELDVDVDRAVKKVEEIVDRYKKCSELSSVVVMNGCDHLPLQPHIREIIDALKNKYKVIIGGLNNFFEELKKKKDKLKVYKGELRKVKHRPILTEVLSSRVYLKILGVIQKIS